jgi:hypothetical protein
MEEGPRRTTNGPRCQANLGAGVQIVLFRSFVGKPSPFVLALEVAFLFRRYIFYF